MLNVEQLRADLTAIVLVDKWGGKYHKETDTYDSVNRSPYVFSWKDDPNTVRLSGEDGGYFCNYYGQYDDGGYAWIHPDVEAVAKKHGCIAEWYDPSHIAFYES
jgi:hypothetical protein